MPVLDVTQVDTAVPFADTMTLWIARAMAKEKHDPLQATHLLDPHYLAWEDVRLKRNPYFAAGTGFEGYLIGTCQTPSEALDYLLATGKRILTSLLNLHRYDYAWRSRMMKTLRGEKEDPRAMAEWAVLFGATLGRLRALVLNKPEADRFHAETYGLVSQLPPIRYEMRGDQSLEQHYAVAAYPNSERGIITIDPYWLKHNDQDAWEVARSIGKFGHPLIREYLRRAAG
jgi:hypothetical protein